MSFKAKFNAWREARKTAGTPESELPPLITDDDLPKPPTDSAEITARFARQEAELSDMRARFAADDARVFVDGLVTAGKVYPYERSTILADFGQRAMDDARFPTVVKFSAPDATGKPVEKAGTRVDLLKSQLSLRPASGMMAELVASGRSINDGDFKALFSAGPETPEEKAKKRDAAIADERAAHGLDKK